MNDSVVFSVVLLLLQYRFSYCRSEGSYFTKMPFLKLDGDIIQAIAVPNILQCCWKCDRLPECLSLNLADVPNKDGLYECEMLRTETNKYSGLLKPSQHYHHYTRLVDKCTTTKCLNEGTCETTGFFDFRCNCLQGFTGKTCHVKTRKLFSSSSHKWLKINTSPVCFGAKDSAFGRFYIKQNGTVTTIKLVHLSGYVTCYNSNTETRSNWGCGGHIEYLNSIITNRKNEKILPQDEFIINSRSLKYRMFGFTSQSPELVFKNFTTPMVVTVGQEYRIWYGEDLHNYHEYDNEGTTCANVYMFGLFD